MNRDNTVSFQNLQLPIERVQWSGTLAGCNVVVHQHLDRTTSLAHGPHRLGGYSAEVWASRQPETRPKTLWKRQG